MQEQIMQIIINAVLSILGVVATYLATVVITYFKKKKDALIKQIGAEQYNATYNIAKSIFYAVEQQYRFIPDAGKEKAKLFNKLIQEKVPGIKEEDMKLLRETVVGEINTQLQSAKLFEPAPTFNPKTELSEPKLE
jgi:hypothetical protein